VRLLNQAGAFIQLSNAQLSNIQSIEAQVFVYKQPTPPNERTSEQSLQWNTPLLTQSTVQEAEGAKSRTLFNFLALPKLFKKLGKKKNSSNTRKADVETTYNAYIHLVVFTTNNQILREVKQPITLRKGDEGSWVQLNSVLSLKDLNLASIGSVKVQLMNHEEIPLFFDEFSVTLQAKPLEVLYTADYYAYGEVMREWKHADLDKHRYGYQGDFAEKDSETGFSHFELRDYDSKIGRWLVPDPMRQFASPYVGMGNDPINGVDPDGGWLFGLFGSTSAQRQALREWKDAGYTTSGWFSGNAKVYGEFGLPEKIDGMSCCTTQDMFTIDIDKNGNETFDFYKIARGGEIAPDYSFESFVVGGISSKAAVSLTKQLGIQLVDNIGVKVFTEGFKKTKKGNLTFSLKFYFPKQKFFIRFERGFRSPAQGTSKYKYFGKDFNGYNTHINVQKIGVFNNHHTLNPFKWKYYPTKNQFSRYISILKNL
jgi:RHS repeat-associated protein